MIAWLRAGYGLALLISPNRLLAFITDRPVTAGRRAVIRVLAARELFQALVMAPQPHPAGLLLSAEVDLVHSASMLGWAAIGNSRRLALTSAAAAACFAAGGVARTRRPSVAKHVVSPDSRLAKFVELRNLVATYIAAYTVPRAVRSGLQNRGEGRQPGIVERQSLRTAHQGAPS